MFCFFSLPIIINHFGKRSTVSGEWSENGGYAPDQKVHVYDAIYIAKTHMDGIFIFPGIARILNNSTDHRQSFLNSAS